MLHFTRRIGLCLILSACSPPETHKPEVSETTSTTTPTVTEDASVPEVIPDPIDEDAVLGFYETNYLLTKRNRAHNIHAAAERLNIILTPGAEVSFNELIGPRTKENGFKIAPIIFAGEMRDGIGGGVCQVSSTVHAAALHAGLEIVKRKPHSRTSGYIQPGLDSTVNFPGSCLQDGGYCYISDLIVKNTHPFRLGLRLSSVVQSKMKATLRAEFVGVETGAEVKYRWYSRKGEEFEQKLRKIKWRPSDYVKEKQKGKDGLIVFSILTIAPSDAWGTDQIRMGLEKRWKSEYDPVDEVWEVGPDWDMEGPPPWAPADPYED